LLSADLRGSEIDSESVNGKGAMPLPKVLRWFWIASVSAFVLTFPTVFLYCGLLQAIVLVILFLCAVQYPFSEPASP
jgi:hypothetical protein